MFKSEEGVPLSTIITIILVIIGVSTITIVAVVAYLVCRRNKSRQAENQQTTRPRDCPDHDSFVSLLFQTTHVIKYRRKLNRHVKSTWRLCCHWQQCFKNKVSRNLACGYYLLLIFCISATFLLSSSRRTGYNCGGITYWPQYQWWHL